MQILAAFDEMAADILNIKGDKIVQKYTVWMSGDDSFDSMNRHPRKFENIDAEDFISACQYVWEHHHEGKNGYWILDISGRHPVLRHKRREWNYSLHMTYEDAYNATVEANQKLNETAGVYNDI